MVILRSSNSEQRLVEFDRLAVLQLEHRDLPTGRVVGVRALGQVGEVGQLDRDLLVGVRDPPQTRRDAQRHGRHEEGTGTDDERQTENPTEPRHSAPDTTERCVGRGGSAGSGDRLGYRAAA